MIGRASMDGTNQTFITRNDMKEPTGLTIDFARKYGIVPIALSLL